MMQVSELLEVAGVTSAGCSYAGMSEDVKVAVLTRELATRRLLHSPFQMYSALTTSELTIVRTASSLQRSFGAACLPNYIISNCSSLSDLLEVAILLREAGLLFAASAVPAGSCSSDGSAATQSAVHYGLMMNIIPLFETIEDLRNSAAIMDAAFRHPLYSSWISDQGRMHCGTTQEVMLGYSDSSKDGAQRYF